MTKHSTDPRKSLRRSKGGTGPRRYQNRFSVASDTEARALFNPRPGSKPAERSWWERLVVRFAGWRDERQERRREAAGVALLLQAINKLEAHTPPADRRTPEEVAELYVTVERITGQTPAHFPMMTAAEWVQRYEDGVGIALRSARRIREGRDPVTGIDPLTGLDDFNMNAEQRTALQQAFDAGRLEFKELPKSRATGERWLEDGVTAVGTWRDTNLRVDPRSRFRFVPSEWVLTANGYMNINGTPFGKNGRTFDGRTPEEHSLRLEHARSPEAQLEVEDQRRREAEIARLFDAEKFQFKYA